MVRNTCPRAAHDLAHALYGKSLPLPLSRTGYENAMMTNAYKVEHRDTGWTSILQTLRLQEIPNYDFSTSSSRVSAVRSFGQCRAPALTFEDLLANFMPTPEAGYHYVISADELSLSGFLERLAATNSGFSEEDAANYALYFDAQSSTGPFTDYCSAAILLGHF